MDAHVFRPLGTGLAQELAGARVDKIFRPAPQHWTFAVSNPAHKRWAKRHLLLKADKQGGVVFFSQHKPANPAVPVAQVMWLRKRLAGRRLLSASLDWPGLRLALELSPGKHGGRFLILDLRQDPAVVDELEPDFAIQPDWPALDNVLNSDDIWREHPQLTPPLRKQLAALPADTARALYQKLQAGPVEDIWIRRDAQGRASGIAAWEPATGEAAGHLAGKYDDPLEAARIFGEPVFFAGVERAADKPDDDAVKAVRQRIKRSLKHVQADERRLQSMVDAKILAEALQAQMYRFAGQPTPERVTVHHPEHGELDVELNTHLSVAENMEKLFAKAAKGRRGLTIVAGRRAQLEAELETPSAESSAISAKHLPKTVQTKNGKSKPSTRALGGKSSKLAGLAVARYTTTDGFTVLRGKSAKANHKLLSQAASPFDLWFHAAGRPGAHAILKRDHPGQEVPEASLEQAAVLAGLSSGFAGEAKADIMCALVKDVRKTKGAAHGQVRVDTLWRMLRVALDEDLPARLEKSAVAE